jgi:hypothetical protein
VDLPTKPGSNTGGTTSGKDDDAHPLVLPQ